VCYIPDPIEILESQIERNIDNFVEGCCMVCGKKVDYELIPASSHPAALAVCFECLSPEDQKNYKQFFESQPAESNTADGMSHPITGKV
jgi:ribosome-binding protein aMBF1 (putative translation factor)